MSASTSRKRNVEAPGYPGVSFGRTADGLLAALVGDHAFAMAKAPSDKHYLVTGWRIRRPMVEWTRADFYGHSGDLADEAALRAKVLEQAEHQSEKFALRRREEQSMASTPWGPSQGATVYVDGVVFHSTAGHGSFLLSPERNRKVHPRLRLNGGSYVEDEAWAIVAFSFPHLFTGFECRVAERTMKDSYPDAWEAITGDVLGPGESRKKDERAFFEKHADDLIVVSAILCDHNPASPRSSPRRVANAGPTPRNGASLFLRTNTMSAASASSSIRNATRLFRSIQLRDLACGSGMMASENCQAQLFRMEEARRQTQRQLDMIDRQIIRRMTALIPQLQPRQTSYRRGRPPHPGAFLERYRSNLAALTAERQPEIDALSRKLARQDNAIAGFLEQHRDRLGERHAA